MPIAATATAVASAAITTARFVVAALAAATWLGRTPLTRATAISVAIPMSVARTLIATRAFRVPMRAMFATPPIAVTIPTMAAIAITALTSGRTAAARGTRSARCSHRRRRLRITEEPSLEAAHYADLRSRLGRRLKHGSLRLLNRGAGRRQNGRDGGDFRHGLLILRRARLDDHGRRRHEIARLLVLRQLELVVAHALQRVLR